MTMTHKEPLSRKRAIQVTFMLLVIFVLFTFFFVTYQPLGLKTEGFMESILVRIRARDRVADQDVTAFNTSTDKVTVPADNTEVHLAFEPGFQPTPINKLQVMNVVDLYKLYLKLVEVPTFQCTNRTRYGNVADGGWDVCQQQPYTLKAPCLVHSWGINWEFSFDDAISQKIGCHVHSFDPSMNVKSFNRSDKIIFHDYGIKGLKPSTHTTWNMKTFDQTLRELNQEKSEIDYLKIDVEGDEWDAIAAIFDTENSFKHIRQVALEVHLMPCVTQQQIVKAVNVLERMRQIGLELYHSHRNPFGMGPVSNLLLGEAMTCCHEVYYVNTKYEPPTN